MKSAPSIVFPCSLEETTQLYPEKLELLKELKVLLGDISIPADTILIKYLIAKDYSVEKAAFMFQSTMQWRKENNIDDYPDKMCPIPNSMRGIPGFADSDYEPWMINDSCMEWIHICKTIGHGCYHKLDKSGCPVYIESFVNLQMCHY